MLSVNAVPMTDPPTSSSDIHIGLLTREILQYASNMHQVDKLIKNYKSHQGWVLSIASSNENQGAAYDLAGKYIDKRKLQPDNHLISVNNFLSEKIYYKNSLSCATNPFNQVRLDTANTLLSPKSTVTSKYILNVLKNTDFYNYKNTIANPFTINRARSLQTIIMEPETRSLYFSSNTSFSPLSKFYHYNLNSGELKTLQEENSYFYYEHNELIKWFEKIDSYLISGNYKKILNSIDLSKDLTLYQVMLLYNTWKKDHTLINNKKLLYLIDTQIIKYSKFSLPYLMKGIVLLDNNQLTKAVKILEKSLSCEINFDIYKMLAYSNLAQSYKKLDQKKLSLNYA